MTEFSVSKVFQFIRIQIAITPECSICPIFHTTTINTREETPYWLRGTRERKRIAMSKIDRIGAPIEIGMGLNCLKPPSWQFGQALISSISYLAVFQQNVMMDNQ